MTGRIPSTPTTDASVAAHGLSRRPYPSLHAFPDPPTTYLVSLITHPTSRPASKPIKPVLIVAHGPLTIRSLL
jgi:hypothetical protein